MPEQAGHEPRFFVHLRALGNVGRNFGVLHFRGRFPVRGLFAIESFQRKRLRPLVRKDGFDFFKSFTCRGGHEFAVGIDQFLARLAERRIELGWVKCRKMLSGKRDGLRESELVQHRACCGLSLVLQRGDGITKLLKVGDLKQRLEVRRPVLRLC